MNKFGIRLKELRESSKMTQISLSTRLGMSQESISSYERGISKPSIDVLKLIADYFNVSADYMLGIDNNKVLAGSNDLDSFELSLIRNFRKLDIREKELIVKISYEMVTHYERHK